MAAYIKPVPDIDSLTRPYWEALQRNSLTVQSCCDCGFRHFPPGPVCPRCLSDNQEWQPVSGRATLLSWVRFHRAYWPGFRDDRPYDVCVVRLAEGPVIVSNFASTAGDQAWRFGMPMEVVFDAVSETLTLPRFRPLPASTPDAP